MSKRQPSRRTAPADRPWIVVTATDTQHHRTLSEAAHAFVTGPVDAAMIWGDGKTARGLTHREAQLVAMVGAQHGRRVWLEGGDVAGNS